MTHSLGGCSLNPTWLNSRQAVSVSITGRFDNNLVEPPAWQPVVSVETLAEILDSYFNQSISLAFLKLPP